MKQRTCTTVDCDSAAVARGLCKFHYNRAYWSNSLPPGPAPRHSISSPDLESKTGICAICGPTRIRVRQDGKAHQCWTLRVQEGKRLRRPDHPRAPRALAKWRSRLTKYGLTESEWDALLVEQNGRCAICCIPMTEPHTDHCHKTGQVRGLLCRHCNFGIGNLRDDPVVISAALKYLAG